jgi:hypothetical protein
VNGARHIEAVSKRVGFHAPHILFKGTILVRGLVLALATETLWVRRGFLVRRIGWDWDGVGVIGRQLRGRLLRSGARIMAEAVEVQVLSWSDVTVEWNLDLWMRRRVIRARLSTVRQARRVAFSSTSTSTF